MKIGVISTGDEVVPAGSNVTGAQVRDANAPMLVDRENAVSLPEDAFFICDILGAKVYDESNTLLGELVNVLGTGSNDVYVVKDSNNREILIPALKSVVKSVSVKDGRIDVTLPEGLL